MVNNTLWINFRSYTVSSFLILHHKFQSITTKSLLLINVCKITANLMFITEEWPAFCKGGRSPNRKNWAFLLSSSKCIECIFSKCPRFWDKIFMEVLVTERKEVPKMMWPHYVNQRPYCQYLSFLEIQQIKQTKQINQTEVQ